MNILMSGSRAREVKGGVGGSKITDTWLSIPGENLPIITSFEIQGSGQGTCKDYHHILPLRGQEELCKKTIMSRTNRIANGGEASHL